MKQANDRERATAIHEEYEHAAEKLEFNAVLGIIAGFARAERTVERILASGMLNSNDEVEESQREIGELVAMRAEGEDLPLAGWKDSWNRLTKISAEGISASGEDLSRIATNERIAVTVARYLEKRGDRLPSLLPYQARFSIHEEIVQRITHAIGPDHRVLDRASRNLARLRKQIAALRDRLRRQFADFAAAKGRGRGEEFVTVRGERYVVSLPKSEAAAIKGIVHQASGSGASLYIEPLEFSGDNNKLESLLQEEKQEVERILRELTAAVYAVREDLLENQELLCSLDALAAKASYAAAFNCLAPAHSTDGSLSLIGARHPLLERRLEEGDGMQGIIPLDLRCGPELKVLVISGPNAGGKTVALKTVGLLVLMDRAGLPVPCAEGTRIPGYTKIFVDIGDDQSIERSLSTFSSRIVRLKRILELVDGHSIVLVDEIGDGTDPEEGAALAEATLDRLIDLCGRAIVTTHLRALKGWAFERDGAVNATLAFDPERLEPLFRLRMGIPGRSWGIEMAGRLGLPEGIVEHAKMQIGESAVRLEELLAHIEHLEQAMAKEKEELIAKERILAELTERYRDRIESFKKNRDELVQEAQREALDIVTATRREMEHLIQDIRRTQAERQVIRRSRERMLKHKEDFERKLRRQRAGERIDFEDLKPGMWVEVISLGHSGKVVSIQGPARIYLELAGGMRVETKAEDLAPVHGEIQTEPGRRSTWSTESFETVPNEISVRGLDRSEALERVDTFLDKAVLQGLQTVYVIHGVGKGILKKAIYDTLRGDPRVHSVHPGEPARGGDGVAVVRLK
ncbi:MAG: Smr/MutS family protein [bacterium]|nr:MAG: Smr/MutS family protein [bacterium]